MQTLSIFFIIFALALLAIDDANFVNVPRSFNIKTSSKNVILVVRDLNNQASYEFCAVQKYRSPFEHRPRLHSNKNSNMIKYHNMIDMSFISQKCSNLRDNLIAKFNRQLDAVHIRFDDFRECSINKIVRKVRTNSTKMVIVGTSKENLKIDFNFTEFYTSIFILPEEYSNEIKVEKVFMLI